MESIIARHSLRLGKPIKSKLINIRVVIGLLGLVALGVNAAQQAQTTNSNTQQSAQYQPSNPSSNGEVVREDRTRSWLALQRSNTQATAYQDELSPEMAKSVQERAAKSFTHAIPEKFITDSFGE